MRVEPFRIPDKIFAGLAVGVMVLTWAVAWWIFPDLPARIPTHFGITGQPDGFGPASWWNVFMPAVVQLALGLLFWWLYRHPQYSNLPSTIAITLVPEPYRVMLYRLIQHFLVVTLVIINLMMAHITIAIIGVAIGSLTGLNPWLIGGLVLLLLTVVAVYSVWLYRIATRGAREIVAKGEKA
ncbi:MAG: DUF1648 domain-containing protein [Candidatus Kerfeldbacteria bacterium]|nr:DUF1648 domain-containing protein [Candidatus Kerfeldbacteria bacterium]